MKQIIYVTGNSLKFEVAQKALEGSGFELLQQKIETPEIQSNSNAEVASFSAKWASEKLQKSVVVTDSAYYINALNGFPGPFIKYINKWLSASDILKLMDGKDDRSVEARDCLSYCEFGGEPIVFTKSFNGKIALVVGEKKTTPIDELFVPEGYDKSSSEVGWEEMLNFWASGKNGNWAQLSEYLKSKNI